MGEIEKLPISDSSVDVVISNCVINLSPDKSAVFGEIYRSLKPGGRIVISDILRSGEIPEEIRTNPSAYTG
jgi:ubiquinone/menaquinone biosynthesis C-methylase UbiE